jgi:hypothetical protein
MTWKMILLLFVSDGGRGVFMCLKTIDWETSDTVVVEKETTVIIGNGENRTQSTVHEEFAADLNSEGIFRGPTGRTISKGLLVGDAHKGGKCPTRPAVGNLWWLSNATCKGKGDLDIRFRAGRLITILGSCSNYPYKALALKAAKDLLLSDFVSSDSFLRSIGINLQNIIQDGKKYLALPAEWCYDSGIFSRIHQSPEWFECGCYTKGDHAGNERLVFIDIIITLCPARY